MIILFPLLGLVTVIRRINESSHFYPDGKLCHGFGEVIYCYNQIVPNIILNGPTSFAPLIREAIEIVKISGQYHILLIVADGQVDNKKETQQAIIDASNYPLSIVTIG